MKAIIISRPGGPEVLEIAERQVPGFTPQDVLIRVKAAGINRPDIFQRKGNYPPPEGVPKDIPGLEVAGIIEKCGSEVRRWHVGDEVCALLGGGGYAEFVAVPEGQCLPVPQGWSYEEASALPETVFTVWHNVFQKGQLAEGETLLIHGGSSGIGTTAIQIARAFGARVFATAGTDYKCLKCEGLGAEKCFNYNREDFAEGLKDTGADVILDMIGGTYISKNISLLKAGGRLVFINAMKGGKGEFDALDIMQRRLTITGSTLRSRDTAFKASLAADIEKNVWPLLYEGKMRPVIFKTFPLSEAADAHTLMESSTHTGKIMLSV